MGRFGSQEPLSGPSWKAIVRETKESGKDATSRPKLLFGTLYFILAASLLKRPAAIVVSLLLTFLFPLADATPALTLGSNAEYRLSGSLQVRETCTASPEEYAAYVCGFGPPPEPPSFSIHVSPSMLSLALGESGDVTVTVVSLNNFNSRVALSLRITDPPAGVDAHLEQNSLLPFPNLPVRTRVVFSVGNDAPLGSYDYTVVGEGGGITKSSTISLEIRSKPAILSVTPSELSVTVGTRFAVNLTVTDVLRMYGWEIRLFYSPDLLQNVSVRLGPSWQEAVDNGTGFGMVQVSQLGFVDSFFALLSPSPSFSGNTTIATLEFRALAPTGGTPLSFQDEATHLVEFIPPSEARFIDTETIDGIVRISAQDGVVHSSVSTAESVLEATAIQSNLVSTPSPITQVLFTPPDIRVEFEGSVGWTVVALDNALVILEVDHQLSVIVPGAHLSPLEESGSFEEVVNLETRRVSSGTSTSIVGAVLEYLLATYPTYAGARFPAFYSSDDHELYTVWWVNGPLSLGTPVELLTGMAGVTGEETLGIETRGTRAAWIVTSAFSQAITLSQPDGSIARADLIVQIRWHYDKQGDLLLRKTVTLTFLTQSLTHTSVFTNPCGPGGYCPILVDVDVTRQATLAIELTLHPLSTNIDLDARTRRDPAQASLPEMVFTEPWGQMGVAIASVAGGATIGSYVIKKRRRGKPEADSFGTGANI